MSSVFAGPSLPALPAEPESPDHIGVELGDRGGGLTVILLGDMNAGPDTPEIRTLTEQTVNGLHPLGSFRRRRRP
jgi:hypothetical protein